MVVGVSGGVVGVSGRIGGSRGIRRVVSWRRKVGSRLERLVWRNVGGTRYRKTGTMLDRRG